jgi:hypothetical protein
MERMEQIRELTSRLSDLTDDELATLKGLIGDAVGDIADDDHSAESVGVLNELADTLTAVNEQIAANDQAAADAAEAAAQARQRIAQLQGNGEDDEEQEREGEGDDEEEKTKAKAKAKDGQVRDTGVDDAEAPVEGEPVAVAAAARPARATVGAMSRAAKGDGPRVSPELSTLDGARTQMIATGQLSGFRNSDVIPSKEALAEAMASTLDRMSPRDAPMGRVLLATAEWKDQYDEDRRLSVTPTGEGSDAALNTRRIDAHTSRDVLKATGGVCQPVNIDWSLDTWFTADRPLRDALPSYQASRGGLQYRQPIDFSAMLGATSVWTAATDANPGASTKPVVHIACPNVQTQYVDAVPTRLGFGNMQSRFDPETVAMNTDAAMAAASHVAELNLLAKIAAAATADITTAALLGAARDFMTTLRQSAAIYRDNHRIPDSQVITVCLWRGVRDLIIIDRIKELAHDDAGDSTFHLGYDWVDSLFAAAGCRPIWVIDPLPANGVVYPLQGFAPVAASTALPKFPASFVWHMWVEGSIQFLDGGRLDLGVVRDSTLDAVNDYETFVETFEGLAFRGYAGSVWQLVTTLCANGVSSAAATVATCA